MRPLPPGAFFHPLRTNPCLRRRTKHVSRKQVDRRRASKHAEAISDAPLCSKRALCQRKHGNKNNAESLPRGDSKQTSGNPKGQSIGGPLHRARIYFNFKWGSGHLSGIRTRSDHKVIRLVPEKSFHCAFVFSRTTICSPSKEFPRPCACSPPTLSKRCPFATDMTLGNNSVSASLCPANKDATYTYICSAAVILT